MNIVRCGERPAFAWVPLCLAGALCVASTGCSSGSGLPSGGWNGAYQGDNGGGSQASSGSGSGGGSSGADASTGGPSSSGGSGGDASTVSRDGAPPALGGDAGPVDANAGLDTGSPSTTFSLIDTNVNTIVDGEPVSGFDPIAESSIVDLGKVGTALSIRANTTPAVVGSVVFVLDGTYTHTENAAPYTLCSDNGAGTITPCPFPLGPHTLIATPYTTAGGVDGGGAAMPSTTLYFTVKDSSSDAGADVLVTP